MRHAVSHHGGDVCEVGAFEELAYFIGQSLHVSRPTPVEVTSLAWHGCRTLLDDAAATNSSLAVRRHRAARRSRPASHSSAAAARAAEPPGFIEQAFRPPSAFGTRTRDHRSWPDVPATAEDRRKGRISLGLSAA